MSAPLSSPKAAAFRLHVERAEDGSYHWVISRVDGVRVTIELATSFEAYRTSREALLQGAAVLEERTSEQGIW